MKAKSILNNNKEVILNCKYKEVILNCKYYEREENFLIRKTNIYDIKHQIKCIKQDFKEISTFYGGNKSDCKFTYFMCW